MPDKFDRLIEAMPQIAEAVKMFDSEELQRRVLDVLLDGVGAAPGASSSGKATPPPDVGGLDTDGDSSEDPAPTPRRGRRASRSRSEPSMDKDLNPRPDGKEDLISFSQRCMPKNQHEYILCFTYWLEKVAELNDVGMDQVLTCFKLTAVQVPGSFAGKVSQVGSKGWLKETKKSSVKVSISGENHVEHDMLKRTSA